MKTSHIGASISTGLALTALIGSVSTPARATDPCPQYDPLKGPSNLICECGVPGSAYSSPALYVRASGEADAVVMGPNNSLSYYFAWPGTAWSAATIAGPGTTYLTPAISVRSSGEADVVAQGTFRSLWLYDATPGSAWNGTAIH